MRTCLAVAMAAARFLAGCGSTASLATVPVNAPHAATAPADRLRAQALVWRLVNAAAFARDDGKLRIAAAALVGVR